MARPIERIAYCSTATLSLESLLVIADILAVSQRNNARDGITGALAYSEGRFFQVIEGAASDVDRLLRRVSIDGRHKDIHIVMRATVEGRLFPDWSMSVPRISPAMAPLLKKAVDECSASPTAAVELMRQIAARDGIHSG